jgi:hypothetical protein
MQHSEKDGALERKPMLALARELLDDTPTSGLLPQPLEHESRPNAPHVGADPAMAPCIGISARCCVQGGTSGTTR